MRYWMATSLLWRYQAFEKNSSRATEMQRILQLWNGRLVPTVLIRYCYWKLEFFATDLRKHVDGRGVYRKEGTWERGNCKKTKKRKIMLFTLRCLYERINVYEKLMNNMNACVKFFEIIFRICCFKVVVSKRCGANRRFWLAVRAEDGDDIPSSTAGATS